MRRMLRLLEELGANSASVSEVDVADPENLKVTEQVEGRAATLILGNRHFKARMESFHRHYPEIRKRLPDALTFDLRLEDRITAVEANASAR